jgi:O-methyltransferase involved in polyketide biosynthesis
VRWFEVDHPATQGDKLRRLGRLGIDTSGVTFVGLDLSGSALAPALVESGFDPDAPSLALCEGVSTYLETAVFEALLRAVRSLASVGTRLAISPRSRIEPARPALARCGQPAARISYADRAGRQASPPK